MVLVFKTGLNLNDVCYFCRCRAFFPANFKLLTLTKWNLSISGNKREKWFRKLVKLTSKLPLIVIARAKSCFKQPGGDGETDLNLGPHERSFVGTDRLLILHHKCLETASKSGHKALELSSKVIKTGLKTDLIWSHTNHLSKRTTLYAFMATFGHKKSRP